MSGSAVDSRLQGRVSSSAVVTAVFMMHPLDEMRSCFKGRPRTKIRSQVIEEYRKEIASNPTFARDLDLNRLEENERQTFIYLQAQNFENQGNHKAACDRYKYLAGDKTFPNAQLSLIKSLKVCDYLTLKNVLIWNTSLKDVEPSFRKLFLENSIELAEKKDQLEYLVNFGVEYTDYLDTKEQKEKHLLDRKSVV